MDDSKTLAPFLTTEWRYLAILNYAIDVDALTPYLPPGTELDDCDGKTYISLVGFLFLNTKVLGIPIPLHRNFEEVNLRFYVRRRLDGEIRRGVVFIKEVVPRAAIALVARLAYNENYVAMPMSHELRFADKEHLAPEFACYTWGRGRRECRLSIAPTGRPRAITRGSTEEFIAEHYWGYTTRRNGTTAEYRVDHAPWNLWDVHKASFEGEAAELYGRTFASVLRREPDSAFLADGSPVVVYKGAGVL